jgi:hypothetical protein
MATWNVKESSEGLLVTKTVDGLTTDYGQFDKTCFELLIGLSEFITHGDVVVTPEGSYYVKHDKGCYNPSSLTNN